MSDATGFDTLMNPRLRAVGAPLTLRVVSAERHGQTIQVKASRCSVGAAANCSLRLRAPGVRPIHCIILRGPEGTVIRSLSPDTTLNGQTFRELPLRYGDRLRLGPIELEVLNPIILEPPATPASEASSETVSPPATEMDSTAIPSATPDTTDILTRLEILERLFQSLRGDTSSVAVPLPVSDEESSPNEKNQVEAASSNPTAAAHATQLVELKSLVAGVVEQLADLSNRLDQSNQQLRTDLQCVGQLQTDYQQQCAAMSERQEALEKAVEMLQCECSQLKLSNHQILTTQPDPIPKASPTEPTRNPTPSPMPPNAGADSKRSLAAPTDNSASRRKELAWLAQQFSVASVRQVIEPTPADNVSATANEHLDRVAPCVEDSPIVAYSADPLTSPTTPEIDSPVALEFPTPPPDESSSGNDSGTDDEAVFDRLARVGIWRKESTEDESSTPADSGTAFLVATESDRESAAAETGRLTDTSAESKVASPSSHSTDDDDSIESYMQRLLERVRGAQPPMPPVESIASVPMESETNHSIELDTTESAPPAEPEPFTASEYLPRSQAPELDANLAAMRELANASRQSNMLSHAQRTWSARSRAKLVGAVAGFATSAGAIFFLDTHPVFAGIALASGMAMSSVLGWQAFAFRRKLFRSFKK